MRKAIEAKDPDTAEILKKGRIILIKRPSLGQDEKAQEEGQEGQEGEDSTEDEEYDYDSDSEDEIKMEDEGQEEEGQLMELDDEALQANLSI